MTQLAERSATVQSVPLRLGMVLGTVLMAAGFPGWSLDSAWALERGKTIDPSGMSADPMGAPPYPSTESSHAQSPHRRGSNPHGTNRHGMTPILQDLNLSQEQTSRLRRIETAYKAMTITKTAEIRVGEVELAALLDEREPDMEAITKAVNTIGAARTKLTMGRVQSLLDVKNLLTAEQYERFRTQLRDRMESLHAGSSGHASIHGF